MRDPLANINLTEDDFAWVTQKLMEVAERHANGRVVSLLEGGYDLQGLAKDEFWTFLDNSDWCHAYDSNGERCELSRIPKSLSEPSDDPYRSLVGELIRAGGFAKMLITFLAFSFTLSAFTSPIIRILAFQFQ